MAAVSRTAATIVGVVLLITACDVNERPSARMSAVVNSLALTAEDTLVVTRTITNDGASDLWFNATAPAFDMRTSSGAPVCDAASQLQVEPLELVRLDTDSTLTDVKRYPLVDLPDCSPGTYTITLVASFRLTEQGTEAFSLRTASSTFIITDPPAP